MKPNVPRAPPFQNVELMAQSQDLHLQSGAIAERRSKGGAPEQSRNALTETLSADAGKFNVFKKNRITGMHTSGGDLTIPSPFVYPERSGIWGCGVVLANMTGTEIQMCARLGAALERVSADDVLIGNEPTRLTFAVIL